MPEWLGEKLVIAVGVTIIITLALPILDRQLSDMGQIAIERRLKSNAASLNEMLLDLRGQGASFTPGALEIQNGSATTPLSVTLPDPADPLSTRRFFEAWEYGFLHNGHFSRISASRTVETSGAIHPAMRSFRTVSSPFSYYSYTYEWRDGIPVFRPAVDATYP